MLKDPGIEIRDDVFIEWGRYEVDHDGFGAFQPIRCVCNGRYKLVINLMTTDEFYDLETDPGELTNLIDSAPHCLDPQRSSRPSYPLDERIARPHSAVTTRGRRPWRPSFRETWANAGMTPPARE